MHIRRPDLTLRRISSDHVVVADQVWDKVTQSYVVTPKEFGKSIAVSELSKGIARFFYPPIGSSYTPSTSSSSASTSTIDPPIPAPLPIELLIPVLYGVLARLKELQNELENAELRIRGSSILIVVEGDPNALRDALHRVYPPRDGTSPRRKRHDREDDDDEAEGSDEDSDAESVSTTDADGNAKDFTRLPWDLRMIDFAHARSASGEGKDLGLLKGIETTRRLIEQLKDRLEKMEVEDEVSVS